MDEISEQLALFAEPPLNPDSLRLDRARADVLDALQDVRLAPHENRVMVWALLMWDADTLDGLASLLFKLRS